MLLMAFFYLCLYSLELVFLGLLSHKLYSDNHRGVMVWVRPIDEGKQIYNILQDLQEI